MKGGLLLLILTGERLGGEHCLMCVISAWTVGSRTPPILRYCIHWDHDYATHGSGGCRIS